MINEEQGFQVLKSARNRLQFATDLGLTLLDEVNAWIRQNPVSLDAVIDADRLGWSLFFQVDPDPPVERWGYMFGDVVHNFRATLDNLLCAIARAEGISEERIRGIQFPAAQSAGAWEQARSRVACLPEPVQQVVRAFQPMHRVETGEDPARDALARLVFLSNGDKHRVAIGAAVSAARLKHSVSVRLEDEPDDFVVPRVYLGRVVADGAVALRWDSAPHQISEVRGTLDLDPTYGLAIVDGAGEQEDFLAMLKGYSEYLEAIVSRVASCWADSLDERTTIKDVGEI